MVIRKMSIGQAAAQLPELIATLDREGEILLTQDDQVVAKIIPVRRITTYGADGPQPGIDLNNNAQLSDLLDEEQFADLLKDLRRSDT